MSPMYWSYLFLYFILIMLLLMTFIYFSYYNSPKESKITLTSKN